MLGLERFSGQLVNDVSYFRWSHSGKVEGSRRGEGFRHAAAKERILPRGSRAKQWRPVVWFLDQIVPGSAVSQ